MKLYLSAIVYILFSINQVLSQKVLTVLNDNVYGRLKECNLFIQLPVRRKEKKKGCIAEKKLDKKVSI